MPRHKKQSEPTDDLLSRKAETLKTEKLKPEPAPAEIPKVLEYTPLGSTEKWRVEWFEALNAEMGITGRMGGMTEFHELGMQHSRPWLICRKLYGIGPMILPANADPAEFEPKSRAEVCAIMGIENKQLQAELDSLRAVWQKQGDKPETSNIQQPTSNIEQKEELGFADNVLEEFGFDRGMFEVRTVNITTGEEEPRKAELNRIERDWFCRRIDEWRRLLSDKNAGGLVRSCLMNELYLKRFEQEMSIWSPSSKKFIGLQEARQKLEKTYQEQLKDLYDKFPESNTTERENYRRVLSELIKCDQQYFATGDHALIDTMNTADEIEVALRTSLQRQEPQYRFGLTMAMALAMNGVNDPNWRPYIKNSVFKVLDAGMREAYMRMVAERGKPLPDLEKGVLPGENPEGEYEELQPLPEEKAMRK